MVISTGRNTTIENVWRSITGFIRTTITGSQRPLNRINSSTVRNTRSTDLAFEIEESPIRDEWLARSLISLFSKCPEAATAIDILTGDVFSSEDGDEDGGFRLADELSNGDPIDPQVKEIIENLIDRVIGGLTLEPAVERSLSYGDSFASIGVARYDDGYGISKILFLPTWEVFRIEDDQGNLLRFEQRRRVNDPNPIVFHPVSVIHWRYRKKFLYGRSIFKESITDWIDLQNAIEHLLTANRTVGINPTVHTMPQGADDRYKDAYKADYESRLDQGSVTDFYQLYGGSVSKLANFNPDLSSLRETVRLFRTRLIMRSRVPLWMFAGIEVQGAREISNQPALSYARHINRIRQCLAEGIDRLIRIELTLKGIPIERQKFRLIFPQIYTNPQASRGEDEDGENENDANVTDAFIISSERSDAIDVSPLIETVEV